jgi:hypothetical protein
MFQTPPLTRTRIWMAYAIAVAADAVQWLLGPIGFVFPDEAIDVAAMAALTWTIGFHPLFLPAFVLELLPIADLLPTWTGSVAIVVALRKRQQRFDPPPPGPGPVIDV